MSFWENKRVLLTGGGGFLGSHVREVLDAAGCQHVFVVRSSAYDITRETEVQRLFEDLQAGIGGWPSRLHGRTAPVDIVIHLAGLVGGIGANKANPADFYYRNLMMGTLMMHYSRLAGAAKFVAAGAGCGYPEHAPMPLKETSFWDGFPQVESAPYSLAKRMLQVQSIAYWKQYRFPAIIGVPGNIYGPYDNFDLENAHVAPALVRKFVESDNVVVWGSGKPTRDFVYAGDVAKGLLLATEVYDQAELVNLSSGRDHSISEVIDTLIDITGFKGTFSWDTSRPDGQIRRLFDVSKAEKDLGFRATTSLRDGLAMTVEWYRANRERARNFEPLPEVVTAVSSRNLGFADD
jgi:GDP-L-fucose synthase